MQIFRGQRQPLQDCVAGKTASFAADPDSAVAVSLHSSAQVPAEILSDIDHVADQAQTLEPRTQLDHLCLGFVLQALRHFLDFLLRDRQCRYRTDIDLHNTVVGLLQNMRDKAVELLR